MIDLTRIDRIESRWLVAVKKSARVDVSAATEDREWDEFLELTGYDHHLQTSRWARLKSGSGWKVLRLTVRDGETIVGGVQILYRKIPFIGRVGYAPRGPVILDSNPQVCRRLLAELDLVVRAENFSWLMIQPPARLEQCAEILKERGFHPTTLQLAPTATILVDLSHSPAELLAAMRPCTRRSIRTSLASGLKVRVGSEADLPVFYSMLQATGRRHDFIPPPLEYFSRLWRVFTPGGHIVMFLAEFEGEVVAAELNIVCGDTMVSKRAGWSGHYAKLHPTHGLIWAALNWGREHGCRWYDFEGLAPRLARQITAGEAPRAPFERSQDLFKLGFGGQVVVLPENHEYVFGRIAGWAHRNLWLKFVPPPLRARILARLPLSAV